MNAIGKETLVRTALDLVVRITVVAILAYVSYLIVKPFLQLILWGGVIAIVLSPVVRSLERRFGHRKQVILLLTLAGVTLLLAPAVGLSGKAIASSQSLYELLQEGKMELPPPPQKVREWPLVGEKTYALWSSASRNLESTLKKHQEEVVAILQWLAGLVGSGFTTVLVFLASLLVAAAFLLYEEQGVAFSRRFFRRLVGEAGDRWVGLSAATVRSVVLGLVGIAVFQALLAYLGMVVMEVPLASLWAVLVLFVAIVQLPPLLVILPVILYGFTAWDTTPAVLFAVYGVLVSMSDALLKTPLPGPGSGRDSHCDHSGGRHWGHDSHGCPGALPGCRAAVPLLPALPGLAGRRPGDQGVGVGRARRLISVNSPPFVYQYISVK